MSFCVKNPFHCFSFWFLIGISAILITLFWCFNNLWDKYFISSTQANGMIRVTVLDLPIFGHWWGSLVKVWLGWVGVMGALEFSYSMFIENFNYVVCACRNYIICYRHKLFYNIFTKYWYDQLFIDFHIDLLLISLFHLSIITHHINSL